MSIDLVDYQICTEINKKTIFTSSSENMFYLVREGFQETAISEGFAKEIMFTSEMLRGEVKLDGQTTLDIGMGDRFKLTVDPNYALKCMKFIM